MAGYNVEQKPGETLQQYYRRLAKTADQRLVRLEKYANDKYYSVARDWAYSRAVRDIKKWLRGTGSEMMRFNTAPPSGTENLLAKINDIKTFLESPTSTKQGITDVYKKRAATVNKKYGTQFTWQQLAKFYDSGQAFVWESKFGSETALLTIAQIQRKKDKIINAIKSSDKKDIRIGADNSLIDKTVNMALKDNQLNLKDLF